MAESNQKKRKERPSSLNSSTSSSLSSPDPKILKEYSESTSSPSRVEDEVLLALNMSESFADQIRLILNKLISIEGKMEDVEATINHVQRSVVEVQSELTILNQKLNQATAKTEDLEKGLSFMDKNLEDHKKQANVFNMRTEQKLKDLNKKLLYQEAYSRRENLKFFEIPESSQGPLEYGEQTKEIIYSFLEVNLGLADARQIEFQRIHRLGKKTNGRIRPIIARFLRFPDREYVMKSARKLKGTAFKIFEDLPKEIIDNRRPQLAALRNARQNGLRASFSKSEPDKLFIDGKYTPHVIGTV